MNIENMKEILGIAHKAQSAVHMIGEHGIGKTEIVKQFAEDQGYHCEVLQLTVMDTGDLIGIPETIEKDGERVTSWAMPVWLQRVNQANKDGKHVVVFLDELGRASIDIRQASLQMVLEGKIQEHSLGELNDLKSLIVVADNPSDDYDSAEFDAALEDRFITLEVESSLDSWLKYARSKGIMPVITDYLAEYPDKLVFKPEDTAEKGSSPRAWEKLSDILKNTPKNSGLVYQLIVSKVGKTVGGNFYQFFKDYVNVIKVEDILEVIGNSPIITQKEQEKVSKKIAKLTKKLEAIQATELAHKLKDLAKNGEISSEVVVTYLASLPFEVGTSIAKSWKETDEDREYFLGDFMKAQENKYYIRALHKASQQGE